MPNEIMMCPLCGERDNQAEQKFGTDFGDQKKTFELMSLDPVAKPQAFGHVRRRICGNPRCNGEWESVEVPLAFVEALIKQQVASARAVSRLSSSVQTTCQWSEEVNNHVKG